MSSSSSKPKDELFQWDDVKTRPHASKIHSQMADSSEISLIVNFGRDRKLGSQSLRSLLLRYAIKILSILLIGILLYAMLNSYTANAERSTFTLHCQLSTEPLPLALGPFYRGRRGGGGSPVYKSQASPDHPFTRSIRELAATSHH